MSNTVAELLVDVLEQIGVKQIFGLIGDSLNPLADAVRRSKIEWVGVRHEEGAALAAAAIRFDESNWRTTTCSAQYRKRTLPRGGRDRCGSNFGATPIYAEGRRSQFSGSPIALAIIFLIFHSWAMSDSII
jgi:Thiamine pyrophosphate enzyme, N-terminal TPP binding domain